jgi:murein DD-endopeptidase MepM/ murein hydrolase activator NlpD
MHLARSRLAAGVLAAGLAACVSASPRDTQDPAAPSTPAPASGDDMAALVLPATAVQGQLVRGHAPAGSTYSMLGHQQTVGKDGRVVFGIPRDASATLAFVLQTPDGRKFERLLSVQPRAWASERIVGAPPDTIEPPPAIAARIAREQAEVSAARHRDDPRDDWAAPVQWPLAGRISGHFGQHRLYVMPDGREVAGGGHSGMDIAAPGGTPVHAPLGGIVTFTGQLYLTGGTVLLDHGQGVSSNFLHLSRIDVVPGQRVAQGEVIGAVGATGRATGPHLHWGMNWFEVRVDPEVLLPPAVAPAPP